MDTCFCIMRLASRMLFVVCLVFFFSEGKEIKLLRSLINYSRNSMHGFLRSIFCSNYVLASLKKVHTLPGR